MSQYDSVYAGQRIRQRRWMLGVSRSEVAERLGIEARQLEAVEAGERLVAGGFLSAIAGILEVPVAYFADGADSGFGASGYGATVFSETEASSLARA